MKNSNSSCKNIYAFFCFSKDKKIFLSTTKGWSVLTLQLEMKILNPSPLGYDNVCEADPWIMLAADSLTIQAVDETGSIWQSCVLWYLCFSLLQTQRMEEWTGLGLVNLGHACMLEMGFKRLSAYIWVRTICCSFGSSTARENSTCWPKIIVLFPLPHISQMHINNRLPLYLTWLLLSPSCAPVCTLNVYMLVCVYAWNAFQQL